MRTQIFTKDILNLETVTTNEDGSETRTPYIVPNVEGDFSVTASSITTLLGKLLPDDIAGAVDGFKTKIVLITPDLKETFLSPELSNFFDPIERVADIELGNFGSIIGLQVVINDKSEGPCLAVADALDEDNGVTIGSYAAVRPTM